MVISPHDALRGGIRRAADSPNLRTMAQRGRLSQAVVSRYVAGTEPADGARVAQDLAGEGLHVALGHLGEYAQDRAEADHAVQLYLEVLQLLEKRGLTQDGRVEVSLKLSSVGAGAPGAGYSLAADNVRRICTQAGEAGTTVTVDMEGHTAVDDTLDLARQVREDFPWLGVVLQAYLRRTEADAKDLASAGSRVRLCKGAYDEPASVAYRNSADVDRAYARALKVLIRGQGYPMIATHDPRLVEIAQALIADAGRSTDSYEFQMLHGVRPKEQRRLAGGGETVRVYLPFGRQWYEYLMRRMAERPSNAALFVRSMIRKG